MRGKVQYDVSEVDLIIKFARNKNEAIATARKMLSKDDFTKAELLIQKIWSNPKLRNPYDLRNKTLGEKMFILKRAIEDSNRIKNSGIGVQLLVPVLKAPSCHKELYKILVKGLTAGHKDIRGKYVEIRSISNDGIFLSTDVSNPITIYDVNSTKKIRIIKLFKAYA
jgi:hypothetical protein